MKLIILLLLILMLFTSCKMSTKNETIIYNTNVNTDTTTIENSNYDNIYVKHPIFTCEPWCENKEIESQISGVLVRRVVGDYDIYSNGYFHSEYAI